MLNVFATRPVPPAVFVRGTLLSFRSCSLALRHSSPNIRYFSGTLRINSHSQEGASTALRSRSSGSSTESSAASRPSVPDTFENVVGTAPYHTSYTLLHHSMPPSSYPSRLDSSFSRLGRDLTVEAIRRKGIVNFWWDGSVMREHSKGHEEYDYWTFFVPGGRKESTDSVGVSPLDIRTRRGVVSPSQISKRFFDALDDRLASDYPGNPQRDVCLLVCTHGARDCRCGDRGGAFAEALRNALAARRRLENGSERHVWERIRVGEVGHVGGHKYAPNLLVYPFGDWLAQLTPAHAPQLLDAISLRLRLLDNFHNSGMNMDTSESPTIARLGEHMLAPLIVNRSIWRGRMGLTKDEQLNLFEKYSGDTA